MRSLARSLFALALMASPALATPPQVVSVQDTLFARNDDMLFILRTVTDNHGLHTILQTDTIVVFRSLLLGDDRGFQTAARVIDYGEDGNPRVESLALPAPRNPYSLFSDFDAWPIKDQGRDLPDDLTLNEDGLAFTGTSYSGVTAFSLPLADIGRMVTDTLQATRIVAPLKRVGGGSTGPDPFDPTLFDPVQHCVVASVQFLNDFANDPALAQLDCRNEDELQFAAVWIVVPRYTP